MRPWEGLGLGVGEGTVRRAGERDGVTCSGVEIQGEVSVFLLKTKGILFFPHSPPQVLSSPQNCCCGL